MPPPSRYQKKGSRTNKHNKGKRKLSPGHQVKHMDALCGATLGFAGGAGQLDAQEREQGLSRQAVPHLHQPRVEVDLTRQRGDGQEGRVAHDEEWCDGFLRVKGGSDSASEGDVELPAWASAHVKEAWVDVGGLLEDDDVPASALRR